MSPDAASFASKSRGQDRPKLAKPPAVHGPRWTRSLFALATLAGCSYQTTKDEPKTVAPTGLSAGVENITIQPAPEHLRGHIALADGARVYARPTYTSPSWSLALPNPPRTSAGGPPRVRAFRVVGVVHSRSAGVLAGSEDFVAVTNDIEGEGEEPVRGCGPRFTDLDHLRMLVYVPVVHIAKVTTRILELEPFSPSASSEHLRMGGGVRVSSEISTAGLPALDPGSSWRWIDADGIRVLAPIPDDAVGLAWDPRAVPTYENAGKALLRDAEGSTIWLDDRGGDSIELTIRNDCGEHRKHIDDPAKIASLRAMALNLSSVSSVSDDQQRPATEPPPVVEALADYRIPAGTPLRWTDGDLAGEVLSDWSVAIGVGQTWDDRRCFPLMLGSELAVVEAPALACVEPDALVLLHADAGFGVTDELALGGSIELGPSKLLDGGPWSEESLQSLLNSEHASVSECLRPMLRHSQKLEAARWDLRLDVSAQGRVVEVEIEARGPTHGAVEDCLRAEAFTWSLPESEAGRIEVPVTLGDWTAEFEEELDGATPNRSPL